MSEKTVLKKKKIKTILVSQPEPTSENSPYIALAENEKVKIDFRPFIHVEGATARDIRKQKISLPDYNAIIFTSRNAVDHFFRLAEEMRYTVPNTMRYYCQSEAIALYLQRYIVYRKRKISYGDKTIKDLANIISKNPEGKFLLPSSDKLKPEIPQALNEIGIDWKSATFFKTCISDLSDLKDVYYDILVFYSPSGIESLYHNFPDFKQNDTRIAVYGKSTIKAAEEKGLRIDIMAPTPETPSMTMALQKYIREANRRR
ncbi:MAG TPA: uroporphyrinogen-III synthase [Flavobacteriales bacterium]|jgi:uroporphyrinogen-III synthase|nr:uroporphyrinogen-III synthase [Flavobacteriales bacterium]